VLQHTPLAVIVDPPLEVIVPPLDAEVEVIVVIAAVVITGGKAEVVNVDWLLYPVPNEFIA